MNNDLISRSRLRKNMEFVCMGIMAGTEPYNAPLTEIDNAPTVDIKDEIAGAYNEGYMCGNKEAEKGRPQGEWNKCDYYSFSQAFINGIVEVISKYGITTVDELLEYLKGGAE